MHEVAELGVAAHWAYKQNGQLTDGRHYRWVRGLLEILEHASGPEEFLEHTKLEMFQDQVFCFTPRGDLIALPQGATPVDFAYAVHSEVGDATVGAKVNGRLVPLRTRLNHGDQVEIITSKGAAPSAAWERFVVTGKARSRIRRFLRSRRRNDYIAHGRELLQRAAHKERLKVGDKRLEPVLVGFQQKTVDDLLAAIGEGSLGAAPGDRGPAPRRGAAGAPRAGARQGRAPAPLAAGARRNRLGDPGAGAAAGHGGRVRATAAIRSRATRSSASCAPVAASPSIAATAPRSPAVPPRRRTAGSTSAGISLPRTSRRSRVSRS